MHDISLSPLSPGELDRYSHWFSDHASSLLFKSSPTLSGGKALAWKSLRNNEVVAVSIITVDDRSFGNLNLVVAPSARRQGVGSQTVKLLLQQSETRQLRGVLASVAPSNTGGQKVLLKNGFARRGMDHEGQLQFQYTHPA
jgi:ribosomal protein S18 acetylase RimI-like enzyme